MFIYIKVVGEQQLTIYYLFIFCWTFLSKKMRIIDFEL